MFRVQPSRTIRTALKLRSLAVVFYLHDTHVVSSRTLDLHVLGVTLLLQLVHVLHVVDGLALLLSLSLMSPRAATVVAVALRVSSSGHHETRQDDHELIHVCVGLALAPACALAAVRSTWKSPCFYTHRCYHKCVFPAIINMVPGFPMEERLLGRLGHLPQVRAGFPPRMRTHECDVYTRTGFESRLGLGFPLFPP